MIIRAIAPAALLLLAACGSGDAKPDGTDEPIRIEVAGDRPEAAMPGKIDPPDAKWSRGDGASHADYGSPETGLLLRIACEAGEVVATRPVASDKGAEAMLAFVGYRGILRLPVENDGKVWRGRLDAADPHWRAVTGGQFYATVAGGGKVITPGPGPAAELINNCRKSEKSEPQAN